MKKGFDGRVFLHEFEWQTYSRRMPVRYIRGKKSDVCAICGNPPSADNPLEHSHLIPFRYGVLNLGLTPDFLDSPENIVSAHKRVCNKRAELSPEMCLGKLKELGHTSLPEYLQKESK